MNKIVSRLYMVLSSLFKKLKWIIVGDKTFFQLELFLPISKRHAIITDIPDGYSLRIYREEDQDEIINLMNRAGFCEWNSNILKQAIVLCVPDGYFVLIENKTSKIVAATMARHGSDIQRPFAGRIDWVAVDPEFQGHGFGRIVAASATNRLLSINYRYIYVTTDDHRIAAIKTFINAGYHPRLYIPEMHSRWGRICQTLGLDFQPDLWNATFTELSLSLLTNNDQLLS